MKREILGTMGALATVLTLAACSSNSASNSAASGSHPTVRPSSSGASYQDALTASSHPAGKIGPVQRVTAIRKGDLSVAWKLVGRSPDGAQLVVRYIAGDGNCVFPIGFQVEETAQNVTLTAIARNRGGTADCASTLATGSGYLDLKAPLGNRALIHASTDPDWTSIN